MMPQPRNSRARFTQPDLKHALKAAQDARVPIGSVRIEPDGSIIIVPDTPHPVSPPANNNKNDWD